MQVNFSWVREDLQEIVAGKDIFDFFCNFDGEVFRALEYRKTFVTELGGKRFFIKYHRGTGTVEILKNLLQLRLPVISARNEWDALSLLRELGIQVPVVAAYGKRGLLPHFQESFIITDDVGTQLNLEDFTQDWINSPPSFSEKLALIREVAGISKLMHNNGICHRDYYICHFLVSGTGADRLTLIDLHRALVKKNLARRWIIKDIGSLYFSAMDVGLTKRDLLRFVRFYSGTTLKAALGQNRSFWEKVGKRARKLKGKH